MIFRNIDEIIKFMKINLDHDFYRIIYLVLVGIKIKYNKLFENIRKLILN